MTKQVETVRYGWKPDIPDLRDYKLTYRKVGKLPARVDLFDPVGCPVFNQQELGSCTANAVGAAYRMACIRMGETDSITPSRLFLYYNTRQIEGTTDVDSGASLRNTIKSIAAYGVCRENLCPYVIGRFRDRPSEQAYVNGEKHQAVLYRKLAQTLSQLKACLADGRPFVFGFSVYDSFESDEVAETGVMLMPKKRETCMGGHAVMAVGYDDATSRIKVQNSWGADWGDGGCFHMPYKYAVRRGLAADFWTLDAVEG